MTTTSNRSAGEFIDIAVIGYSGRFPGAADVAELWRNLANGKESVQHYSDADLIQAGVTSATLDDKNYVKAAALVQGSDMFDAAFFGLPPREAELTDPQLRLFLESAWEALEDAGYTAAGQKVGVFAGAATSRYYLHNLAQNPEVLARDNPIQLLISNEKDFLASKVAYHLDLTGPAMSIQTACSTSLVAVHQACESLMRGNCDIALAGGVSITVFTPQGYLYTEGSIMSRDGHCRAFDERASGTVGGNGLGIVVLKPLAKALADGDSIRAVIRGSAVNNDGSDKVGFTAPSVEGQAAVVRQALAAAGTAPDTIGYVEAHGTGTVLGDPIEMRALGIAFNGVLPATCPIGSLKTNVGHLDTAAGVAGLIKTVLALEHEHIPPSLHFERGNPHIDFEHSPFYVNSTLAPWPRGDRPRRAGVSSFGIGGTNAHLIVEEAPAVAALPADGRAQLLVVSARTPTALETACANLRRHLQARPDARLDDVAHTLQSGRRGFEWRRSVVCTSIDDAVEGLVQGAAVQAAGVPEVAFMFPGQGSQVAGMGRALYETEAVYRDEVNRCCELLVPWLGCDLRELLFPAPDEHERAQTQLERTRLTQPALFVTEYAMARQWQAWGIAPHALIGHSVGEYVAACLAGVFRLEDALALVAQRGRLIDELASDGGMLAVQAPAAQVEPLLGDEAWLAAINAPGSCTVAGTAQALARLAAAFDARAIAWQRLRTSHAFHSGLLDPVLAGFARCFEGVTLSAPTLPVASNVSGTWLTAQQATDPAYWVAHLRQAVRFSDGLQLLLRTPGRLLLEVGPGRALAGLARQHDAGKRVTSSMPEPARDGMARHQLLQALGWLWQQGCQPNWKALHGGARRRVPLPTYPFERQRYWVDMAPPARPQPQPQAQPQGKRDDPADWFYAPSWHRGTAPHAVDIAENHLVLLDRHGLDQHLLTSLRAAGEGVIEVEAGDGFTDLGQGRYRIDPHAGADYERLFAALAACGRLPRRVTHLLGLTPADCAVDARDGFHSVRLLGAAWAPYADGQRQLNVIANGVHAVIGNETLMPEKATVLGPCLVLGLEQEGLRCRHIDVVVDRSYSLDVRLCTLLVRELQGAPDETAVAYRGRYRWVRRFEPVTLPATRPPLRADGCYLITGALGGIGMTFARYLAERVPGVTLVLNGRRALDAAGRDAITELETLGAHVHYISADITDRAQVEALAKQVGTLGRLRGVFHAAGLASADPEGVDSTPFAGSLMAPKIVGTQLLGRHIDLAALDFMLLCSSVSTVAPLRGHTEYCAANAFLDTFAHEAWANGCRVMTINWSTWQGVGMAADRIEHLPPEQREQERLYLSNCIAPEDAPHLFDCLLSVDAPQTLITPVEFDAMRRGTAVLNDLLGGASVAVASPSASSTRPNLGVAYAAPQGDLEEAVADIWQSLFGISNLGVHDDFFDLGGHSLLATQVVYKIRSAFDVELPLRAMFEAPTIAGLAARIEEIILKEIDEMSEEEALDRAGQLEEGVTT